MKTSIPWHAASIVTMALALGGQALADPAETAVRTKVSGSIDDYTADLDGGGPWHVTGAWTVWLRGHAEKGTFSAALNMVRAENPARAAHTHHVKLRDGDVTPLANGFQVTGAAEMTGNGNLAGFSGSPVTVHVTGGNALPFSNVSVTFGGGAVAHFGDQPLHGVVTARR
jgi:hypothetical protein